MENMKQGNPKANGAIDGDGDDVHQHSGLRHRNQRQYRPDGRLQDRNRSTNYRIDITGSATTAATARARWHRSSKSLTTAQIQPHPIVDMCAGLIDAGNWDGLGELGNSRGRGFRRLHRQARPPGRHEGRATFPSSCAMTARPATSSSRHPTRPGRPITNGAAPASISAKCQSIPTTYRPHTAQLRVRRECDRPRHGRQLQPSDRHQHQPKGGTHDFIFGVEHSAIRWLEQNGYDVSYISGRRHDALGQPAAQSRCLPVRRPRRILVRRTARQCRGGARPGVNLAFWSGNEVYWKVRWETSIDGNGTPYRTMVTYKETWGGTPDPTDVGTGTWRDVRFAEPGQEPENSLTGTMFTVDSYRLDTITIPYDYSNLRFWRNTDVADLQLGQTYSLVQNLLGYEWDSDVENGFRPAGLINMSLSTVSVDTYLRGLRHDGRPRHCLPTA